MIVAGAVVAVALVTVEPTRRSPLVATIRRLAAPSERTDIDGDLLLLSRLVLLGLGAGSTLPGAIRAAAAELPGPVSADALDVLRRSTVGGAEGFVDAAGPSRPLFVAIGRAATTGAPMGPAVAHLVDELHDARRARAVAAARRLPVKLLFPLALLILPGFLLMTLGPTVVDGLRRLVP